MNDLFAFEVLVHGEALPDDIEHRLLGLPGCLTLPLPGGEHRAIRGILAAVARSGARRDGAEELHLTLVPRLWLLGKQVGSRVFQDRTVRDVVDAVLDQHRVDREWRLSARTAPRAYVVQHQESDLAFVTRLLAEEGLFYFFEHGPEPSGRLVIGDAAAAHTPLGAHHWSDSSTALRSTAPSQTLMRPRPMVMEPGGPPDDFPV
jgi:type VI secretion system secreted protein VgrG